MNQSLHRPCHALRLVLISGKGFEAAEAGRSLLTCPYKRRDYRDAWLQGHEQQSKQGKEQKR